MKSAEKILVIKLGALGDVAQSLSCFEAIKQHHPQSEVYLLTTKAYADFCFKTGIFTKVLTDQRSKNIFKFFLFLKQLSGLGFTRIYDLQMVDRTQLYYRLWFGKKPEWVGIAKSFLGKKCSHYLDFPNLHNTHSSNRYKALMTMMGITPVEEPNLQHFIKNSDFNHKEIDNKPYVLIVPGASLAHGGKKIWPQENYGKVCQFLSELGMLPVLIGGKNEDFTQIKRLCPKALDLAGKTTFEDIMALSINAKMAIGNDTGPMHLAAVSVCPTVTLFSKKISTSTDCGPQGKKFLHINADDLQTFSFEEFKEPLETFMKSIA